MRLTILVLTRLELARLALNWLARLQRLRLHWLMLHRLVLAGRYTRLAALPMLPALRMLADGIRLPVLALA